MNELIAMCYQSTVFPKKITGHLEMAVKCYQCGVKTYSVKNVILLHIQNFLQIQNMENFLKPDLRM